ncbi:Hypp8080 [Branchiostoma lanceolatum]|uniref:Hypp8080 protein n=1 Tax=Branchiostoma lanceolatum TaxID=7740 RepID=A0A8K0ECL4_BRALA|nr:Hypp8080 [Branchiostoma lanceolatum]
MNATYSGPRPAYHAYSRPNQYLLCRQCGLEIAKASDLNKRPSKAAHRQRNDTIAGVDGVLIQLFKNPQALPTGHVVARLLLENQYLPSLWLPPRMVDADNLLVVPKSYRS